MSSIVADEQRLIPVKGAPAGVKPPGRPRCVLTICQGREDRGIVVLPDHARGVALYRVVRRGRHRKARRQAPQMGHLRQFYQRVFEKV